jgi:hypothetical protein
MHAAGAVLLFRRWRPGEGLVLSVAFQVKGVDRGAYFLSVGLQVKGHEGFGLRLKWGECVCVCVRVCEFAPKPLTACSP